jgi:hypothetical protein
MAAHRLTLADLDVERDKTLAEMAKLSLLLTDPEPQSEQDPKPKHRYQLRGISVGPKHDETFVLVDPEQAIHPDGTSQWWRIRYSHDSISKEKCYIDKVLAAAKASKEVMLVYASDKANKPLDFDVRRPLHKFVEDDNAHFAQELAEYEGNQLGDRPPPYEDIPPLDAHWGDEKAATMTAGPGFTPDPGSAFVSDAEYRMNTQYADFAGSSARFDRDGDAQMGGSNAEHIEHVVEEEDEENK